VPTPTLEQVLKERVAGLIGEDLEAVEAEIHRELYSPVPLIQEMGGYIARAGAQGPALAEIFPVHEDAQRDLVA